MLSIKQIYQLKITLQDIEPLIWRTIQVSSTCTFWDLHSYIQDAFGWTNSHMHQFIYTDISSDTPIEFGIPIEPEYEDEHPALAGWQHKITRYMTSETGSVTYIYDLGDYWQHIIELEGILEHVKGIKYPRCIAGERNSPPEDCGGPHGYVGLLETLFDPNDPEHEGTVTWVDSMKGGTFDPEEFDLSKVRFAKPGWRLKRLLDSM
jgi:hypothetical protein